MKLTRSRLKSRHIQFIALGGTIGTGLFLGIGSAFIQAGPLSLLLGYTFTGVAIFGMVRGYFSSAPVATTADPDSIDAIARRNGNMATASRSNTAILRSLR